MKSYHIFATILAAALATACNGIGENDGKKTGGQMWVHEKPQVAMVEISSGDNVIETYEYTYDEQGRMLTLVRTDHLSNVVMLDLSYTYPGENQMKVQGTFFPIKTNRYIDVSCNPDSGTISYTGSWSGAWSYTTTVGSSGVISSTVCQSNFASSEGYYTSNMDYSELYTVAEGTVTESVIGTGINAKSSKSTRTANSSTLKTIYSKGDQVDRQNFAAYLMPDYFPVWIASGLPGNKTLITGISSFTGTIQAPETTVLEYSFNAAGNIDSVVRTDRNGSETVLTRTYKFFYKE